ncbi:efflux RND transporter periplasmic adaptor subunit [Pedobacter cryophilus]|uniref:Efflux RND transporter periplasmic adaptor subunit n=1 Tax=Pedobacter cryophilus TaxID=2571271 RepID=A0A4U1BU82_9SPHI|nr:efflux RND transporter periplasmic adaptor subunit [Pedobacter cryophilus]TKB96198.1 efflux RND transporter periplasmic adaptor subunit [Pedobacter cryophilus]
MKKIIIPVISVITSIVVIGWVLTNNKKENEAKTAIAAESGGAVMVRTKLATKNDINLNFTANGTFAALQDLTFLSENSGRVTRITVDEGSKVSKGQVLAYLDAEILGVNVRNANATYQNALRDLERYQSSYQTGGVTQQQFDQAKLGVENSKAMLQEAKRKLSDANIKSPINGIVNKRFIEQGAYVSAGKELFELVDVSKLKLALTVNESQVANLKVGDQVKIKSNVVANKDFVGKITFIAPKADNSLNFPVEIELVNNAEKQIKAGMYGTAIFEFPKQAPTLTIPRTSFVGSVSSNKIYVMQNRLAKERKVIAGRILAEQVEILDGLKEGETVIISGQINLIDGVKVAPIK